MSGSLYEHKSVVRVVLLLLAAIVAWALLVQQIGTPPPAPAEQGAVAQVEAALPDFSAFRDAREKKRAFFDYLLPVVEAQNAQLRAERTAVEQMLAALDRGEKLRNAQREQLAELVEEYPVDSALPERAQLTALRKRVDSVPVSLALQRKWKRDPRGEPRSKHLDQRRAFFFDERSDKPSL